MKKILSFTLIASSLFATSLDSALKQGTIKGDFAMHYEHYNFKNAEDSAYAMYSVGLNYKSKKFNNFQINLGFRSNDKIYELHKGDYDNSTKAILHTANITYNRQKFKFLIGRNKEELQWIHGYQEEIKFNIDASNNTDITLLHAFKHARANDHEEIKPFTSINDNKGLNVVTISSGKKDLHGEVYFYNAPNLADWYGGSIKIDKNKYGMKMIYSKSIELTDKPDGSYFNVEGTLNSQPLSLTLGYIQTDKNGGLGSMTIDRNVYDNMNPLEEGNHIFEKNAKTFYASSEFDVNDKLSFTLNLGHIRFQQNKANEIDFYTDYAFNKNFGAEICIDTYHSNINTDNSTAFKTQISYKF